MLFNQETEKYILSHSDELLQLLLDLARIPAPSGKEEQRAKFCLNWLKAQGAEGVYVDDALNVLWPIGCSEGRPIVVFAAHSDTVFPDTDPMPLREEGGCIFCPGVGDDTANAAVLLMAAKYIAAHGLRGSDCGILLAINSCEEGLGNLKGCRKIFEEYGGRICRFISFDGYAGQIVHKAVGSRRYMVKALTEGGHSYRDFGKSNAIACLASLINDLYCVEVTDPGTTYNVGLIRGGTSVNTIAQDAEMVYEFRSDERGSLERMEREFSLILDRHRSRGAKLELSLIGDRPCSAPIDEEAQASLMALISGLAEKHFGFRPTPASGSTDCNIPLSMGIPSVCIGCVMGGGAHTRQEYILRDSLIPGAALALETILSFF